MLRKNGNDEIVKNIGKLSVECRWKPGKRLEK